MASKKEASPFTAIGGIAARLGARVLGKAVGFGGKAVWGGAKFVKRHPGTALTGAFVYPWAKGYSNTARTHTLSTMKRKLPSLKFAGEEDSVMTTKYPKFLYKIDGFEKMAADAETARNVVKSAFKFKLPFHLNVRQKLPFNTFIKDYKLQEALTGRNVESLTPRYALQGTLTGRNAESRAKGIKDLYNQAKANMPKHSFGEAVRESVSSMPPGAIIGMALIGATPAAILAEKAISNTMEQRRFAGAYRDMMQIYPDLRREKREDVKRYFDYIAMYSPTVAHNPHAAGSLIKRFVHSGGMLIDNNIIESLLNVEKIKSQVSSSRAKSTETAIANVAKQLGGSMSMGSVGGRGEL